jgi:carbon-monoxide dehydrogenase small subunit
VSLSFRLNGQACRAEVRPHELLVDFIRDRLGLVGTKKACDMGACGACTILVDGRAVTSCAMFAFEVQGKDVLTIEGLVHDGRLHPLQEAFLRCGGFQCGFCTPGMILLAKSLLDEHPEATDQEIKEFMNANVCRCTGYQMIVESVRHAAASTRPDHS